MCEVIGSKTRGADTLSEVVAKRFYREYFSGYGQMEEFVSLNELESKLVAAKLGHVPIGDFVQELFSSEIALPTASEVQTDGSGFEPVLFDKEGTHMLAAFTARERVAQLGEMAKFCLMIKGGDILRRMPKGYGLVVNPGLKVGFELSPQGISEILADFG